MKIAKIISIMKIFTNFRLPFQACISGPPGHSSHFVGCFTPSPREKAWSPQAWGDRVGGPVRPDSAWPGRNAHRPRMD